MLSNNGSQEPKFLRLSSIIAPHGPLPISKSTWWAGVRSGRYPKPVKLGPGITAWRAEDISALIAKFEVQPSNNGALPNRTTAS
jgi:predicted DNA-binding transcriptional regulator AlpA